MGFNTVAVLYNDTTDIGAKDPEIGKRIHAAVSAWSVRSHRPDALDIFARFEGGGGASYGQIISQAHADYSQIVVVGGNTGKPLAECSDLDVYALGEIKEALERHGYRVTKRRKPKAA